VNRVANALLARGLEKGDRVAAYGMNSDAYILLCLGYTGSMQVSGSEVEDALCDHEAVSEVAVIGLPDEKWIEAVSTVVVLKDDAEAGHLREELEEHVRGKLADFRRPKHLFFVEDLPRNAAGKILKRELRSTFAAEGEE
jgi:fatty-acyl-CoA synthase